MVCHVAQLQAGVWQHTHPCAAPAVHLLLTLPLNTTGGPCCRATNNEPIRQDLQNNSQFSTISTMGSTSYFAPKVQLSDMHMGLSNLAAC
jgi:hypothetical protein